MGIIIRKVRYFILLSFCSLIWAGCNIINPAEPIPTYVHIDSFNFKANPYVNPSSLTLSHQITAVWAYYNNSLVGEFDLPVTFPVITNGTKTGRLELFPAIKINGQNNTVDMYPFYQSDTSFVLIPQPGKTVSYNPTTCYYSTAKPYYLAKFGFSGIDKIGWVAGNCKITSLSLAYDSLFFEGGVGSIYMNNPGDSSVDSSSTFTVPTGSAAYIEFNYKSDVYFTVGIKSNLSNFISASPYPIAGIAPSATWQKFYMNLTAFINSYAGTNYNFYINTQLPTGQSSGRVLLQNIQLVTF